MQPQQKLQQQSTHKRALSIAPQESRPYPQQKAAEEAILGALLLDREAILLVQEQLPVQAFYSNSHQLIYQTIVELYQGGHPLDMIAVVEYLKEREQLDQVGGPYQLVELTHRVGSSANIEHHTQLVLAAFCRRQLLAWSHATLQKAYRTDQDALELLDQTKE